MKRFFLSLTVTIAGIGLLALTAAAQQRSASDTSASSARGYDRNRESTTREGGDIFGDGPGTVRLDEFADDISQ